MKSNVKIEISVSDTETKSFIDYKYNHLLANITNKHRLYIIYKYIIQCSISIFNTEFCAFIFGLYLFDMCIHFKGKILYSIEISLYLCSMIWQKKMLCRDQSYIDIHLKCCLFFTKYFMKHLLRHQC